MMRYWLFDGDDVAGPFSPEELAARADFSAASLLAPETKSEEQNAWQRASSFPEFEWNEETGALTIVPSAPEQAQPAEPAASVAPEQKPQPIFTQAPQAVAAPDPAASSPESVSQKPQEPQEPSAHVLPLPEKQTPVPLAKPIVLAEGTDDIISLPVHEEPAAQEVAPQPQEPPQPQVVHAVAEEEPAAPIPSEMPTLLTRELPTGSSQLPNVDQIPPADTWEEADLDNPFEPQVQEAVPPEPFSPAPTEPTPVSVPEELVSLPNPMHPREYVVPQELPPDWLDRTEPLITPGGVRKVLKPHLTQTPEINTFLHAQQEALRPGRRKAKWMLWILFILLIPGAVALAVHKKQIPAVPAVQKPVSQPAPAKNPVKEPVLPEQPIAQKSVVQTEPEEAVIPAMLPPAAPKPALGEQAIEIVKNYQLSGNRGTTETYLNRMYQTQLDSGGYASEWSAEPLHKSIYIVKYRLTKTRNEPIVYVFQADVSKGKVVGALNNITLDLIGKI